MKKKLPALPEEYSHKAYYAVRPGLAAKLTKVTDEVAPTTSTLRRGSDVERRSAQYLWPPYIPLGELTAFAGPGESGKTMTAASIVAALTSGGELPANPARSGSRPARFKAPEDVLVIQRENAEGTILDRVESLGGDIGRLILPDETFRFSSEPGDIESYLRLSWYLEASGARFIFIDPITGFIDGQMNDAQVVRVVLERLRAVAEFTGSAITYVVHLNKKFDAPIETRVMGSVEFFNVPRSVLMASTDPDTPKGLEGVEDKLLYHRKSNLGRKGGPLGYRLSGDAEDGSLSLEWRDASDRDLAEVTAQLNGSDSGESRSKPGRIRDVVVRTLLDADEVILSEVLKATVADRLRDLFDNGPIPPATWSRAVKGLGFSPVEVVNVATEDDPRYVPKPDDARPSGVWGFLPIRAYVPTEEESARMF